MPTSCQAPMYLASSTHYTNHWPRDMELISKLTPQTSPFGYTLFLTLRDSVTCEVAQLLPSWVLPLNNKASMARPGLMTPLRI
jgi:hypothetical protein